MQNSCGNCRFWGPEINQATGRMKPSLPGDCLFEVRWPELPWAYTQYSGRIPLWPLKHKVWKTDGEYCKLFESKR